MERLGGMVRLATAFAAMALPAVASPAAAATIVILTDPMTLEKRTVVVDPNGPDRAFLCMGNEHKIVGTGMRVRRQGVRNMSPGSNT